MGNTVSAAERLASDIVHPTAAAHVHAHVDHSKAGGVPPPECPMHQKGADDAVVSPPPQQQKTLTKECPLGHDKDETINPLNMVCCCVGY